MLVHIIVLMIPLTTPMAMMGRMIDPSLKRILLSDQRTYKFINNNKRNMVTFPYCNRDYKVTTQLVNLQTITTDEMKDLFKQLEYCYRYYEGIWIVVAENYSICIPMRTNLYFLNKININLISKSNL
jgi:hypothetical protein